MDKNESIQAMIDLIAKQRQFGAGNLWDWDMEDFCALGFLASECGMSDAIMDGIEKKQESYCDQLYPVLRECYPGVTDDVFRTIVSANDREEDPYRRPQAVCDTLRAYYMHAVVGE